MANLPANSIRINAQFFKSPDGKVWQYRNLAEQYVEVPTITSLEGYVSLATDQTISGNKTFASGTSLTFNNENPGQEVLILALDGNLALIDSGANGLYIGNGDVTVEGMHLMLVEAPTQGFHGTNKTYVDSTIATALSNGLGVNVVSAASSLTLGARGYYSFNGTTATWNLPALSTSVKMLYRLINMGSGTVTLMAAGSDVIWDSGSEEATFPIASGQAISLYNNGIKWALLG